MKLIFKSLKPFVLPVLLCLALLFGNAYCDLSLPNLMSELVNTGIQMGGIDEEIPDAITATSMDMITKFMDESARASFTGAYDKIAAGHGDATKYPASAAVDIYTVKPNLTKEEVESAATAYHTGTYGFLLMMKAQTAQSGAAVDSEDGLSKVDPQMMDKLGTMVAMIPEEAIRPFIEEAKSADIMVTSKVSTSFTKLFYTAMGMDLSGIQTAYIWTVGAQMLLIALLGVAAAVGVGYISAKVAAKVSRKLRQQVFRKVTGFTNAEFDKFSTASLITRTTNDVQQVQMLITMGLRIMCYAPIMGIGGVFMAVNKSVSLSWIIAAAVAVMLGLILIIFAVAMPKFTSLQKLIDKLNLVSRENLSGLMVIRAFGNEKYEENRFDKANDQLTKTNRFVQRTMSFMMPAMMLIMNLVTLTIVWVGAKSIAASTLQIGDMMAFMQYAMQIIMSFLMISMMFIMVPRAVVSANRINEVLTCDPTILDPTEPKAFQNVQGNVEFHNVSFHYGDAQEDVLHNISFVAKSGQTTAFIGSTGSGKSTLINLIPRFYDVTSGSVTIDGTDVRAISQHQLREKIGYVPQKGVLFSGDIRSNVGYGQESISDEMVNEAIRVAQAEEFVSAKEEGIHAPISQGGTNVSGGQKQRLAIARALAKRSPIYIFDDSFSALDFKTDATLRRALKEYTGDATVLIVAQRVSTIMNAEQIIVLDDGEIVGKGTHRELLQNCPTYREIAESQLSKEELE